MRGRSSHNNNLKHTNMKYTVVIVETLSRKVEVDAADAQEAKRIVADQYNSEQIVLSADDFYGYEIETL
nr:MAG TPA: DpnD/PcfM-like protein [Caudoviricetes sp.]